MKKREACKVKGVRLPVRLWKALKERSEEETRVNGYWVTATTVLIRALNVELAKAVRRG